MLQKVIENKLAEYIDPYLGKDLLAAKAVKKITIEGERVDVTITLGYPCQQEKDRVINELSALLQPVIEQYQLTINLNWQINAHVGSQAMPALPGIKNIIAVGSGKGGVGKSTVAVNLALALAKEGAQVGLLDADIYGPSQPTMLGAKLEKPVVKDNKLQPIIRHGIQSMSIGYLVEQTAAMVWRGPMLGKAMQQMINDTAWQALDYLIIDLPPGTGDVQLTLCQKIPVSGAVMVTTPQDLALIDVRRACEMFAKLNVPLLGVIENMSVYQCANCGHAEHLFGQGAAAKLATEFQLPQLGQIPLNIHIREMTDNGNPPVVQAPQSDYAKAFYTAACRVAAAIALQPKDYSARFPKIVVEHSKKGE